MVAAGSLVGGLLTAAPALGATSVASASASLGSSLSSSTTTATTTSATAATDPAPTPRPASVSLTPTADTTVYNQATYAGTMPTPAQAAAAPTLEVSGNPGATCSINESYALMQFDVSNLPTGAVLSGVQLSLSWQTGFAVDGDWWNYVVALPQPVDNLAGSTWAAPAPGVRTPGVTPTNDLLTSPAIVGQDSAYGNCGGTPANTKLFPRNAWVLSDTEAGHPLDGGAHMSRDTAERNFIAAVEDARANHNGLLALQIFNPVTSVTRGGQTFDAGYASRYASSEATDPAQRPKLTLSFATATAGSSVPTTVNGTAALAVTAGVEGVANTAYQLEVSGSTSCTDGILDTPSPVGRIPVTTGANGLAVGGLALVPPNHGAIPKFINVSARGDGELSVPSDCIATGPDNDIWPRRATLNLTGTTTLTNTSTGFLTLHGQARWYRLPVQPGGRVTVNLTNLPADYDLAVFGDIEKAYKSITDLATLTKVTAEYAPSVFSPSVFSPSVFSPSVFSPEAFTPSVFSPGAFSPSVFSPSVFSPSVFSPSVFSPSVFSPSVFSPSVFSPSVFSPDSYTIDPSLPAELNAQAFADAQARTITAVSAATGTTAESATVDTWNNDSYVYVRVTGKNGASVPWSPFTLTVTRTDVSACAGVAPVAGSTPAAPAGDFATVILRDTSVSLAGTATDQDTLNTTLARFADHGGVKGSIVDLAGNARVQQLRAQVDSHPTCPYAVNLLAAGIKDVVTAYRAANPNLKYVVLIGADGSIPFFRYPDQALLGPESDYYPPVKDGTPANASLRLNYILGQDEYGAVDTLDLGGERVPVPNLAVGRLVESAPQITGMLTAYLDHTDNGTTHPTSALVTGYDFLTDAAEAVKGDLSAGLGSSGRMDSLIDTNTVSPASDQAWTATQLKQALTGSRHDLVYLAGHFSANSALAADYRTSMLSTELDSTTSDYRNTLVFSAGCHSGYNIDDRYVVPGVTEPLDWVQAFAARQATVIAGTGYQYGDTEFIKYSEQIYANFAEQLRYGTGPVAVGAALVDAKRAYLAAEPDSRGLHRKALIEAALYGLPMFSVDLPSGRMPAPTDTSAITLPSGPSYAAGAGNQLDLRYADLKVSPMLTSHTVPMNDLSTSGTLNARYLSGPNGVVSNPAEPAVPLDSVNVTVPNRVLRGVGFRGGAYTDSTVVPLTGAASTELRGVHAKFTSPVFFPLRLVTPNYYDALDNGPTRIHVTPVQHRALPGTYADATQRRYTDVDVRLFYSAQTGRPAQASAPSIGGVNAVVDGADVVIGVDSITDPAAGIPEVWVTYTGDAPRWASLDLKQCAGASLPAECGGVEQSTHWVGRLVGMASRTDLQFIVQAVNGSGLVSLDDNAGAYYRVVPLTPPTPPADTTLTLSGVPGSVVFGSTLAVTATLTSAAGPVAGQDVTVNLGASGRSGVTDANGKAVVSLPVTALPGAATLRAGWPGTDTLASSATSAGITVTKAPTTLTMTPTRASADGPVDLALALRDGSGNAMPSRTVLLEVPNGSATPTVRSLTTDYLGNTSVTGLTLPHGMATLRATYLGAVTGIAASSDPTYLASNASTTLAVASVTVTGPATATGGGTYAATAALDATVTPAPTWSLVGAPSWLSIDPTSGAISGNLPVDATSFSYQAKASFGGSSATSQSVAVTVAQPADLAAYLIGASYLKSGQPSAYAVVVLNRSTGATTVAPTLTIQLPAGESYAGALGPFWTCTAASGNTVVCQGKSAMTGRDAEYLAIAVNVTARKKSTLTVTATVTPPDAVPANNTSSVTQDVR